ncbi:MAG: hypothetical protein ACLQVY_28130 [Limisphaerales bacterium]
MSAQPASKTAFMANASHKKAKKQKKGSKEKAKKKGSEKKGQSSEVGIHPLISLVARA